MADSEELRVGHFLALMGGAKGVFDSSVPAVVFIVVRLLSDLNTGIVAAVAVGLLVMAYRRARGESLQYCLSGFFGLLVAVAIAKATGTGKGFFLPGIVLTALSGIGFALSNVVKQPAVALTLVAIDAKYETWKTDPALRRACVLSTWVWAASFLIRSAVATAVALTVGDNAKDNAILFGVIQVERYALLLGAAFFTVWAVRRVPVAPVPQA
ncbi:MAG: hypothetical protein JWL79_2680 [Frankiales bacterium]|nr:hypothetical protein [Frankiales bacterium]